MTDTELLDAIRLIVREEIVEGSKVVVEIGAAEFEAAVGRKEAERMCSRPRHPSEFE